MRGRDVIALLGGAAANANASESIKENQINQTGK